MKSAVAAILITLAIVFAFLTIDSAYTHLYIPKVVDSDDFSTYRENMDSLYSALSTRVNQLQAVPTPTRAPTLSAKPVDPVAAIARLSELWSLDRLEGRIPPAEANTMHPQAIACFNYIMLGEGSAVECGYLHGPAQ